MENKMAWRVRKKKKKQRLNKDLKTGLVIVAAVVFFSLVSIIYTPYGYNDMNTSARFSPPGIPHVMGTDNFGRDVFSRVMEGGRYTLFVAFCTVSGALIIGSTLGLAAGYFGGTGGEAVMRLMDTLSAFPGILLSLVMVAVLRTHEMTIVVALTILFIPFFTRVTRSSTLRIKSAGFIKNARLMGASHVRIIFFHVLPNLRIPLISAATIAFSNAILSEASLSYLGLGIQPPLPSWGRMLSESQNFLFNAPWCSLSPGLVIIATVFGFYYLGEGLNKQFGGEEYD